ncbi:Phosphoribosyl-ATP pyrophosphohydrolase, partial [Dysosmobacter welbionis]
LRRPVLHHRIKQQRQGLAALVGQVLVNDEVQQSLPQEGPRLRAVVVGQDPHLSHPAGPAQGFHARRHGAVGHVDILQVRLFRQSGGHRCQCLIIVVVGLCHPAVLLPEPPLR